jgi:hypothetical protein
VKHPEGFNSNARPKKVQFRVLGRKLSGYCNGLLSLGRLFAKGVPIGHCWHGRQVPVQQKPKAPAKPGHSA